MRQESDFWSRRRAAVTAEAEAAENRRVEARLAEEQAQEQTSLAEKSDAEILQELQLPDPDTLNAGDDFTGFMTKAVPEHLRRRALRRLWRSNPVLANVDMLLDYGEDYTDSATVVENLNTAYQIGKGMMQHVEEMARQADTANSPPPSEDDDGLESPAAPEPVQTFALCDEEMARETDAEEAPDADVLAPTPRRMRFQPEESNA